MRRVALFLVAAFLLSGCTVLTSEKLKPVPETLTHGRLVYLGDRTCERFFRRVERDKPAKGYLSALTFLQNVYMPGFDHVLFKLRALAPPPSDAVAYRRMLASINNTDLVLHHFFQAADELQRERVKTLSKRLDRLSKRINARAAKVGLKACAKE